MARYVIFKAAGQEIPVIFPKGIRYEDIERVNRPIIEQVYGAVTGVTFGSCRPFRITAVADEDIPNLDLALNH